MPAAPPDDPPVPAVVERAPPVIDLSRDEAPDYFTKRFEPAGFPILGGNSDIGFEFGGVLTLTRFADGKRPYAWNMDLVLTASVKDLPTGTGIAQQSYLWQLDVPALDGGRLRLNPMVQYSRTINEGYFGVGNATPGVRPAGATGQFFQYVHEETGIRHVTRYVLEAPVDLMLSTTVRYVDPTIYPGSQLAHDVGASAPNGSPLLVGVEPLGVFGQAAGIVYDTRDTEVFTRSGAFHQIGVKFAQAVPDASIHYGEAGAILASFTPLGDSLVLAARGVVDFQFGKVPFYDLYQGGVFVPDTMPGGSSGVRGVPQGRYLGPIKVVGNVELRSLWLGFHVFGQTLHLGNDVFFDAGRLWSDYTFRSPLDGNGLGLKWGAGGGLYLLWGQAALFRVEAAYSPDAESENPGFPLGIYVEDGVMF